MCTAITYQPRELYMGRSLDYEASYGEEIVMLPRRFPLRFRHCGSSSRAMPSSARPMWRTAIRCITMP